MNDPIRACGVLHTVIVNCVASIEGCVPSCTGLPIERSGAGRVVGGVYDIDKLRGNPANHQLEALPQGKLRCRTAWQPADIAMYTTAWRSFTLFMPQRQRLGAAH